MIKLPEIDIALDMKMIVQEAISKMLCEKLSIPAEFFLRSTEYMPTYRLNDSKEKILKNLYIRMVAQNNFKVLTYNEIEISGATWQEVIEFLLFSGSKKIKSHEFYNLDIH